MAKFNQRNTRAAKITIDTVLEIRRFYSQGWTQSALSREFQLSIGQIGRIVRGEAWQSVKADASEEEIRASQERLRAMLGQPEGGQALVDKILDEANAKRNPAGLEGFLAPKEPTGKGS